jgi:hypothetical protein
MQAAPPQAQAGMRQTSLVLDNIMLLQMQVGMLFSIVMAMALRARKTDPGLHKRLMFLAVALPLLAPSTASPGCRTPCRPARSARWHTSSSPCCRCSSGMS